MRRAIPPTPLSQPRSASKRNLSSEARGTSARLPMWVTASSPRFVILQRVVRLMPSRWATADRDNRSGVSGCFWLLSILHVRLAPTLQGVQSADHNLSGQEITPRFGVPALFHASRARGCLGAAQSDCRFSVSASGKCPARLHPSNLVAMNDVLGFAVGAYDVKSRELAALDHLVDGLARDTKGGRHLGSRHPVREARRFIGSHHSDHGVTDLAKPSP
jgi:hypothetical protein